MRSSQKLLPVLIVGIVVSAFIYGAAGTTVWAAGSGNSGNTSAVSSSTNGPYQYSVCEYSETISGAARTYRIVIPTEVTTIRGLLVVSNGSGGDSRDFYKASSYEEFLHLHGFAFLGGVGAASSHADNVQIFQRALARFAQVCGHPELVNVPYATTGFSAGGGFSRDLLNFLPERVIAAGMVGTTLKFSTTGEPQEPAATRATPLLLINGELENMGSLIAPVLAEHRPLGAEWGYMELQGRGHEMCGQEVLTMPYLDAAVRLRYPASGNVLKGPLTLNPLDPLSGWVADNRTLKTNWVNICPAAQFTGDIQQSSWLLSKDIAYPYRAYASFNRPLTITSPTMNDSMNAPVQGVGSSVPIVVDATKFPGWKKLEFYDGATKLGEITQGSAQFTATNLALGYHVFSVLGTDAGGDLRPSNPVMVIVRSSPTGAPPAQR